MQPASVSAGHLRDLPEIITAGIVPGEMGVERLERFFFSAAFSLPLPFLSERAFNRRSSGFLLNFYFFFFWILSELQGSLFFFFHDLFTPFGNISSLSTSWIPPLFQCVSCSLFQTWYVLSVVYTLRIIIVTIGNIRLKSQLKFFCV